MFGKYSSQLVNMYHYSTNNPGLVLVSNGTNESFYSHKKINLKA